MHIIRLLIVTLLIISLPIAVNAQVCPSAAPPSPQIVKQLPPRVVKHPKGKTGGALMQTVRITPADEYYLDYAVWYGPFDWKSGHSGKIPGLGGGTGTAGCKPLVPNGWTARQHYFKGGVVKAYLYTQDRKTTCGTLYPMTLKGAPLALTTYKTYRITQRIKINTPNQRNGIDQVWVDGSQVLNLTNVRWRGNVSPTTARVDHIRYDSYSGGKLISQAPTYDSYAHFCNLYVMKCVPDFTKAPGTCKK